MNWEALGALAELAGAIGVIVSLLYLATQIRQNTRSVRMTAHHSLMSEFRTNVRVLSEDPEYGRLFQAGLTHPEQLSEADRPRFGSMVARNVQVYEELYAHHRAGLVERDFWETRQRNLFYFMSLPGVQAWWCGEATLLPGRSGAEMVSEDFRLLIDDHLHTAGLAASGEGEVAEQGEAGEAA